MKTCLLHAANPASNTMKVVEFIQERTGASAYHVDDQTRPAGDGLRWVVVVPNYGDGEIQAVMENFIVEREYDIREFSVVELGNYYGMDDWAFGAAGKLARVLEARNARPFFSHLSLDTLPKIDWDTLGKWVAAMSAAGENRV